MQFEGSTQARSWIFDDDSLKQCRLEAVSIESTGRRVRKDSSSARKFASGYHQHYCPVNEKKSWNDECTYLCSAIDGARHQETYVRFHAHQIQTLIGPKALLPELRRSASVLSTAIMLFRRFYLSNSAVEICPRKIAAASAFFASKLEEERVEVRQAIIHDFYFIL